MLPHIEKNVKDVVACGLHVAQHLQQFAKIVCHILSFGNLLKDLASEKKDHLQ